LFSDKYKTHKYSVGRAYSCWMLNCRCITWPVGFKRLIVSTLIEELHVSLLMLVIGRSFARHDDGLCGGVYPPIFKLGQIREISASLPGRFSHGEDLPFFIFIEYDAGCDPEGVWMLSRKFLLNFYCIRRWMCPRGGLDVQQKIFCTCKGLNDVQPQGSSLNLLSYIRLL
jgi:hypothetical protein